MAENGRSRRRGRGRRRGGQTGNTQDTQNKAGAESSAPQDKGASSPAPAKKSSRRSRRGRGRSSASRTENRRPKTRVEDMYIKMPDPIPERDYAPCPVCGKAIDHVFSAVAHRSNGLPAHIECIVGELSKDEHLDEGDRIVYLGRGNFGVVGKDPVVEDGKKRFNVKRRIQYETGSDAPDWRRELSPGISRDYTPEPERLDEVAPEKEQTLRETLGTDRDAIYMPRLN
ncbi:MAG: hypothetical protein EA383_02910 [Spirochaetaceae bacterium]|nr:MAG: hypothetical protein EA383_02910 [Spirochaetaceae bacterium]